jgi:predicted transcriptional regulator
MSQSLGGPFAAVPVWIYDVPEITTTDIAVLTAIHSFAGPSGRIYPSLEKIGQRARVSRSTIKRSMARLIECGALVRNQRVRKADGGQATNLYVVRFDDPNLAKELDDDCEVLGPPDGPPRGAQVGLGPGPLVGHKADNNLRLSRRCSYEHSGARDAREELDQFGLDDELAQDPATPEPEGPQGAQSSDPLADPIDAAFEAYNQAASLTIWPACKARTPPRRAALRKRLREFGGLEGWKQLLQLGLDSPFLTGKGRRPGSDWLPSFDFFLRPSTLVKLSEGAYDAAPTDPTTARQPQGDRAAVGWLESAARVAAEIERYDGDIYFTGCYPPEPASDVGADTDLHDLPYAALLPS